MKIVKYKLEDLFKLLLLDKHFDTIIYVTMGY